MPEKNENVQKMHNFVHSLIVNYAQKGRENVEFKKTLMMYVAHVYMTLQYIQQISKSYFYTVQDTTSSDLHSSSQSPTLKPLVAPAAVRSHKLVWGCGQSSG